MSDPIRVAVLGSTGSIGTQTLDVVASNPKRYTITGLACGRSETIIEQARRTRATLLGVADPDVAQTVQRALPSVTVVAGPDAAETVAKSSCDVVVNGIDGAKGLPATLAALQTGKRLALANKESLILGADLITPDQHTLITPVDSEHSAIAQCLRGGTHGEVARLVLTASGGPFRGQTRDQLGDVTCDEALNHPTWSMGPLITINSATLANKALEVIEAHVLFDVSYDHIDVVVHPQSIVHSMVEFCDGATIAKLSPPDMRLPIQLALSWPERINHVPARMDWTTPHALTFEPVDVDTFPMLGLAYDAGRAGGTAPAVLNAANETAVAAFISGNVSFLGIADVVKAALDVHDATPVESPEHIFEVDQEIRRWSTAFINLQRRQ